MTLHIIGRGLAVVSAVLLAADSIGGCYPLTIADAAPFNPPRFEEYTVSSVFHGKPAPVDLSSHPRASLYRTMLRTQAPAGPNFAGHFTIAGWGCGTACLEFAIVDAETGRVQFIPHLRSVSATAVDVVPGESEPTFYALRYRLDSRLLVVLGMPNEDESLDGIAYYE